VSDPTIVHFELRGVAPALNAGGDSAYMPFQIGAIEVSIQLAAKDDADDDDNALVMAEASRPVSEDVTKLLKQRESYLARLEASGGSAGLDQEALVWMLSPPAPLVEELSLVADDMRRAVRRLVQTLRWLMHKTEAVQPLVDERLHWSLDGEVWYAAPPNLGSDAAFIGSTDRYILDESNHEIVQRILDTEEFAEPLARQILLEAGALLQTNPRAACVLAVAAAENGMKQFVARVSNQSEAWLISEVPSPPLPKLMSEYFQHLLTATGFQGEPVAIPKRIRKVIDVNATRRNHIVHRGVDPPSTDELEELLAAVDEFLYTLDWVSGHDWAERWLPAELRAPDAA
jgi:hypothetical protein